jgi:uncharacterized protein YrrD
MPKLSRIEDRALVSARGRVLGRIERVLFSPSGASAVALMIRREPWLYLLRRADAFVPLDSISLAGDVVRFDGARLPSRKAVARAIGIDPDLTVIWRGMPVRSTMGGGLGTVADVEFSLGGQVLRMYVSSGAVAEMAVGRTEISGELVRGFDGRDVLVEADSADLEAQGGLARRAVKGAVSIKEQAGVAAKAAEHAISGASYAAGRAIASATRFKPVRRARGAWAGITGAFREGYDGDKDAPAE